MPNKKPGPAPKAPTTRVTILVPCDMLTEVSQAAADDYRSISSQIIHYIRLGLDKEEDVNSREP